jgi:undecaprenyl-diphosphatase
VEITLFQAIVLGAVQGLSEFLPISSSGHLILVPWLLGWPEPDVDKKLTFDLALHLGTSAALLAYFWRDWVNLIRAVLSGLNDAKARASHEWTLAWLIVIGCIPAGIVGVLFEDFVETRLRTAYLLIGVLLILFGGLLYTADRFGAHSRSLGKITLLDAVVIGFAQVLALSPGVSRSGITMTAGLFRGLDRTAAARFSFLLSAPITIAAALFKLRGLFKTPPVGSEAVAFVAGIVVAAVVGALAIGFMLRFLQRQSVAVFFWYRLVAGLVVIGLALAGH